MNHELNAKSGPFLNQLTMHKEAGSIWFLCVVGHLKWSLKISWYLLKIRLLWKWMVNDSVDLNALGNDKELSGVTEIDKPRFPEDHHENYTSVSLLTC